MVLIFFCAMSDFTKAQREAIGARGNVLVVAGAGTGKTRTLVERCLRLVLEEGCSLEEILMVTFTEAAAAEMRGRIRGELVRRWEANPEDARLNEQIALLDTARIGTLHGFCLQLVRQHFHELEIDPQVVVLDEAQTRPLMEQTLDGLLEGALAGTDGRAAAVRELLRAYGRGADGRVRGLIVKLHAHAQSLADPEGWWAGQAEMFGETEPGRWRAWLGAACGELRERWLPLLRGLPGENAVAERVARVLAEAVDWGTALVEIRAADGEWPKGRKTELRKPLVKLFEEVEFLGSLFPGTGGVDPLAEDWEWVRGHMGALVSLGREFAAGFGRAKRELGGVDFADLEQLALRLLREPESGRVTRVAAEWRSQLKHVFVDEYQDINGAQDAILAAVSREGERANRFLVGDVKQSIYRFRLANPRIFLGYEAAWRGDARAGTRVPLADNFRSRGEILDFINPLFGALMRPSVGGVVYDEDARLKAGRTGDAGRARVELLVVAKPGRGGGEEEGEWGDLEATEREARVVAGRLKALRAAGYRVGEGAEERGVEWRDMAVLLRSPGPRAEAFAKEFHRLGVPLAVARAGFYDSLEVSDLRSLLQLLDNPLQDLPLLAVLRSPLVGMSAAELAEVRLGRQGGGFWDALRAYQRSEAERGRSGWAKADAFLRRFDVWRERMRRTSLSYCLETALAETHYEALLEAGGRGAERVANVRRLLELARQYDPYQRQGLYRFLRFIEAQEEAELDAAPALAVTADAVRLLSIHRSKGLEFPVVVVAGLGGAFNTQDLNAEILLDEEMGLCPRVIPPAGEQSYPSVAWWRARQRGRLELLGEELRLLYVALTRARERLILAGSMAKAERWEAAAKRELGDGEVVGARCYLDWLRLWLPQVTAEADWADDRSGGNGLLRWEIHREDAGDGDEVVAGEVSPVLMEAAGVNAAGWEELRRRVTAGYRWETATTEPAKTSVSMLRRRRLAAEAEEEARPWSFAQPASGSFVLRSGAGGELTATERGTAHHTFQELVEVGRTGSLEELRQEGARMVEEGWLRGEELAVLNWEGLAGFWASEMGEAARRNPRAVQRELPFTMRVGGEDLAALGLQAPGGGLPAGEFVVVQGVVDMALILGDEIRVVDFKTDRVGAGELRAKARAYEAQLGLYGRALERIYDRPVRRKWLYFLEIGRVVEVF